jgi:phosphoribosyl 1,2-cyclic phosphate phosphodiesterase
MGVPVVGCVCAVCTSADPRDARSRTAILIQSASTTVVIDAGPDFRQQMLREKVRSIDAVVLTHEHRDHIAGLDDIRPFNIWQNSAIDVFSNEAVQEVIKREYHYAFGENPYPGAPRFNLKLIDKNAKFSIGNLPFQAIEVMHGKLPILCYRIADFTYITDCKTISESEFEKIKGTKTLIINALHYKGHYSHLNVEEALALIEKIQPEHAYLLHCSHLLGKYSDVQPTLPKNVTLSYDGLCINIE